MGLNVKVDDDGAGGAMSDINVTPMVDVMLVILIIFLITVPVITKTVKLDLPKASNIPTVTTPENITIAVDAQGNIYWRDARVPNRQALGDLIRQAATTVPQPEIHVRGDLNVRYEHVGRVILALRKGGIQKVGFISEPDRGGVR